MFGGFAGLLDAPGGQIESGQVAIHEPFRIVDFAMPDQMGDQGPGPRSKGLADNVVPQG